jgi:hypothetical protein
MVAFDVFRVAEGKLAEHWDALTPQVAMTASGRTQIEGPAKVTDLDPPRRTARWSPPWWRTSCGTAKWTPSPTTSAPSAQSRDR